MTETKLFCFEPYLLSEFEFVSDFEFGASTRRRTGFGGRFWETSGLTMASDTDALQPRLPYFFGKAIAWAATHCHSPFRSTQVSVKR
jgi:hypothetical protein